MKASITSVIVAAALVVAAATPTLAATSDSDTSGKNGKLSCQLTLTEQDGMVLVSWTITGATSASIDPVSLGGKVPLKGSKAIDKSNPTIVLLVAKDADGNAVHCHAGVGGTANPVSGTTGSTGVEPEA
jgi:hypothetical protein